MQTREQILQYSKNTTAILYSHNFHGNRGGEWKPLQGMQCSNVSVHSYVIVFLDFTMSIFKETYSTKRGEGSQIMTLLESLGPPHPPKKL